MSETAVTRAPSLFHSHSFSIWMPSTTNLPMNSSFQNVPSSNLCRSHQDQHSAPSDGQPQGAGPCQFAHDWESHIQYIVDEDYKAASSTIATVEWRCPTISQIVRDIRHEKCCDRLSKGESKKTGHHWFCRQRGCPAIPKCTCEFVVSNREINRVGHDCKTHEKDVLRRKQAQWWQCNKLFSQFMLHKVFKDLFITIPLTDGILNVLSVKVCSAVNLSQAKVLQGIYGFVLLPVDSP